MTAPRRSRNVVVILGMHRSGTSAVARLLAQCGLQLGDDLLTQAELDNPNGYWEPRGIVAVHEALLDRYLDRTWYGPKSCLPYPAQWWQRPEIAPWRHQLKAEIERALASTDGIWGFKDPRTARLLPLWKELFAELGVVARYLLVVRSPAAVISSLVRRNGMWPERAALQWLLHNLTAVAEVGGGLAVLDFDRLVGDPESETRRVCHALGLNGEAAADAGRWIDGALRHDPGALPSLDFPWLAETYGLLRRAAAGADLAPRLSDIKAELDRVLPVLVASLPDKSKKAAAGFGSTEPIAAAQADDAWRAAETDIARLRERLSVLEAELEVDRNESRRHYDRDVAALRRSIADLQAIIADRDHRLDWIARALCGGEPATVLADTRQSTSWRWTSWLRRIEALCGRASPAGETVVDPGLERIAYQVVVMRNSLSWRLTRPLRAAMRLLRRADR